MLVVNVYCYGKTTLCLIKVLWLHTINLMRSHSVCDHTKLITTSYMEMCFEIFLRFPSTCVKIARKRWKTYIESYLLVINQYAINWFTSTSLRSFVNGLLNTASTKETFLWDILCEFWCVCFRITGIYLRNAYLVLHAASCL